MAHVRPFTPPGVDFAIAQAVREGWTPARTWFEVFLAHDPGGCFVLEADGAPAGTGTTTCFGRSAWIGYLIASPDQRRSGFGTGYGTTGVLMTLLLHPVRESADHPWVRKAALWFFVSLVPVVPMLVLAVMRRVSEYGFTEGRYVALLLGVWFGLIALYFIVGRTKDIRVVPASLVVGGLLAAFGPWSAFSVSKSSQVGRLRAILEGQGGLSEGKIVKRAAAVPPEERRQVSSILSYIHGAHGYEAIQPWFAESLREDSAAAGARGKDPAAVARMMGLSMSPNG